MGRTLQPARSGNDAQWPETRRWARQYVADRSADPKYRKIVKDLLAKAECGA